MAGLAGHNMDDIATFNGQPQQWSAASGSSTSPDGMANDLTSLFEAVGGGLGNGGGTDGNAGTSASDAIYNAAVSGPDDMNPFANDEELSNILKELF